MATSLVNVTVKEVSLVSKGANRKTFCLTKSADPTGVTQMADAVTQTPAVDPKVAEQIAKADEAVAKANEKLAALEKAQTEAVAKAEALEKALNAEREARELTAEIAKCAADYKDVPMPAAELAVVMRTLRKSADKDVFGAFEKMLKGVSELVKKSTTAVGSAAVSTESAKTWDVIQGKARELMKSDAKLTLAKATDAVLSREPELYIQHLAEGKA